MKTRRLIETYGRRYTAFSQLVGFAAIALFGILIAFSTSTNDLPETTSIRVEQAG